MGTGRAPAGPMMVRPRPRASFSQLCSGAAQPPSAVAASDRRSESGHGPRSSVSTDALRVGARDVPRESSDVRSSCPARFRPLHKSVSRHAYREAGVTVCADQSLPPLPAVDSSRGLKLRFAPTGQEFQLACGRKGADRQWPVLKDRLSFIVGEPPLRPCCGERCFTLDSVIKYQPFCADFGPFNLGMMSFFA